MNIVMLTGNIMLANRLKVHYDRPSTFINIIIVPRVQNGVENGYRDYIPIIAYGKLAEYLGTKTTKGTKIFIQGSIEKNVQKNRKVDFKTLGCQVRILSAKVLEGEVQNIIGEDGEIIDQKDFILNILPL